MSANAAECPPANAPVSVRRRKMHLVRNSPRGHFLYNEQCHYKVFFATPFCRKLQNENVGYCRTVLQVLAPTFCRFLQSTMTVRSRLTYLLQTYRYWFTRMWFALPAAVKARFWSARLHGSRQGKPKVSCNV